MSTTPGTQTLDTVPFGRTDMTITRVGFGAWAVGGGGWAMAWSHQDDADSIAAIRRAVESGVNWIDTAPAYGLGHSEDVVAEALRPFTDADRPYVFTKCGLVRDHTKPMEPAQRVGRPDIIRREVEESLRRLRTERIDLYQMHWPAEDGTPLAEYWQTLLDLRREGKVRAVGLSNHDVHQLQAAEELGHVDTLQPPLSLINRSALEPIRWCEKNGVGVIVYSPMQSGLLSGTFTAERAANLPEDDWRSRGREFTEPALSKNLALAEALRPIAKRHGVSVGAIAVAAVLASPGVTGAIVGARRPEQIDGWLPAANVNLTEADLAEISHAIADTGAGAGPDPF